MTDYFGNEPRLCFQYRLYRYSSTNSAGGWIRIHAICDEAKRGNAIAKTMIKVAMLDAVSLVL